MAKAVPIIAAIASIFAPQLSPVLNVAASTITSAALAATIASQVYEANQARKAAKNAQDAAQQDRLVTFRSTDAPREIAYGTVYKGGVIAYDESHGADKRFISIVVLLAHGQSDAIEEVFLDNVPLGTLDASGYVQPGSQFYKAKIVPEVVTKTIGELTIGTTFVLPHTPAGGVLRSVAGITQSGAYKLFASGTDYSLSGNVVTILSDAFTNPAPDINPGANAIVSDVTFTYDWDDGRGLVQCRKFLGNTSTAAWPTGCRDTELEGYTSDLGESAWASTDLWLGVTRIRLTVEFDSDIFGQTGLGNITVRLRGNKVYNWVSAGTAWSNNALRCCVDYLTTYCGFTAGDIDSVMAAVAQNVCDESVPTKSGGSQARYTCDVVLSTDADPIENLKILLGAMCGSAVPAGPMWRIRAGAYEAPVFTLTDTDLAPAAMNVRPAMTQDELFNSVQGLFNDPSQFGQSTNWPPYVSATYVAEDGGAPIFADFDLPATNDPERAQRIAKLQLRRARQALRWTATYNLSAWPIQAGDTIRLKHSLLGWDSIDAGAGKEFRVLERKATPDMQFQLVCQEESAWAYEWSASEAVQADPTPNTAFPNPRYVPPLASMSLTSDATTYDALADGTVIPYAMLTWPQSIDSAVRAAGSIRIEWKRVVEGAWHTITLGDGSATSAKLTPVGPGDLLNARIVAINAIGIESAPLLGLLTCSSLLPTGNVPVALPANDVGNGTFAYGTTGWSTPVGETGMLDALTFRKDSANAIPGSSSNAVLEQAGTQAKYAVVWAERSPAVAGQRYYAAAGLLPVRCSARVQVSFVDINGVALAWLIGETAPAAVTGAQDPLVPGNYARVGGFVTAPAGSVAKFVHVMKFGTESGSSSKVYVREVACGPATSGQQDLPPFAPGPAGQELIPQVLQADWAGPFTPNGGTTFLGELITPEVDSVASITAIASVSMTGGSSCSIGIGEQSGKITYAARIFLTRTSGTAASSGTATATVAMNAGESYRFTAQVASDATLGNISVSNVHLRVTVTKRGT